MKSSFQKGVHQIMTTTKIERALLDAVKTLDKPPKLNPKGDRQAYLDGIFEGIRKIDEDVWESLEKTPGAQDWYTAAVELRNEQKDLVDFSDEVIGDQNEDASDKEEVTPARGRGRPKSTEPKAEKVAKPKKEKEPSDSKPSRSSIARDILADDPEITLDDLKVALEKKGFTVESSNSLSALRSDFIASFEALKRARKLAA